MPINYTSPLCARPGCEKAAQRDGLCIFCWRLARMFGKDTQMFRYAPLHGYGGDRATVELPWESWAAQAEERGMGLADLFADAPADEERKPPGRRHPPTD